MNHVTKEQWLAYVKDELDEEDRINYDNHLYGCDQCLLLYLEAVEVVEQQAAPMITTEKIIQHINATVITEQSSDIKEPRFYKDALFHYIVAAAMTVVLMSSGVFSQLVHAINDIESQEKNRSSLISKIIDSSLSIIDQVEAKEGE